MENGVKLEKASERGEVIADANLTTDLAPLQQVRFVGPTNTYRNIDAAWATNRKFALSDPERPSSSDKLLRAVGKWNRGARGYRTGWDVEN